MKKNERELIFQKFNGHCAYCGVELQKGWHADHVEPIRRNGDGTCLNPDNDKIENYYPSCASCNILKSSLSIEDFRSKIQYFINSLNQYSNQYKFAKKYGLVIETGLDVKFYYETIKNK